MPPFFPRWGEDISPEEFVALYGSPQATTYNISPGNPVIIPPDPGRYLLAFWSVSNSILVIPDSQNATDYAGVPIDTTKGPLILSWQNHGPLPGLGFTITSVFTMPMTVIIGRTNYEILRRIEQESEAETVTITYTRRRR